MATVNGGRAGISRIILPQPSCQAVETALDSLHSPRASGLAPASRAVLDDARRQLEEFLEGRRRALTFPVDLSAGTAFQRRVWRAILAIPYGRARSYRWVATRVGGPAYARAVGLALGANPVPIVVPCHRVVASDSSLGGFTGGLHMKRKLLALEGTLPLLARERHHQSLVNRHS